MSSDSFPRTAYIHVPFCRHRCGYCDFTLIAGRDDLVGDYLAALSREMRFHEHDIDAGRSPLDTLFLGGGTPTHPEPADLRRLFALLYDRFEWTSDAEVSVEANPLDLTDEKRAILDESGVNRISLGVQSFSAETLKLLERDHAPDDIPAVVRRVQRQCENVSVDLIFGVPGQTLAEWMETLRRGIELGVPHISTYGLTFESGTAFETRRQRGQLARAPEELERDMYAAAMDVLTAAGYEQYEISNFARPGFECRHNQVYWQGREYFAYGPGAARYVHGRRETNIRSVLGWLSKLERNESPVGDAEELAPEARARELIYLGLRTSHGVRGDEFRERTGFVLNDLVGDAIRSQQVLGLLDDEGDAIRLTREGKFVADRVVLEFL
ncbi:MAG: radical SAM family heme chaperone HemW [Planctomycetaceae bacterium]|nr:radical SAM family heme chaperone HemW [Planctomycetaceae bacterium]